MKCIKPHSLHSTLLRCARKNGVICNFDSIRSPTAQSMEAADVRPSGSRVYFLTPTQLRKLPSPLPSNRATDVPQE